jgi:hypothetical protein
MGVLTITFAILPIMVLKWQHMQEGPSAYHLLASVDKSASEASLHSWLCLKRLLHIRFELRCFV